MRRKRVLVEVPCPRHNTTTLVRARTTLLGLYTSNPLDSTPPCLLYLTTFLLKLFSAKPKGGHHRHHDDDDHHGKRRGDYDKCSQPITSDKLPMKCTVTDRCNTYTCSGEFEGETVTLSLKIDRSKDPLSAEISLKVPGLGYEWSATFKSGDKIQVPGFPLTIKGLGGADMYLTLTMDKRSKGISFQASFRAVSIDFGVALPELCHKNSCKVFNRSKQTCRFFQPIRNKCKANRDLGYTRFPALGVRCTFSRAWRQVQCCVCVCLEI